MSNRYLHTRVLAVVVTLTVAAGASMIAGPIGPLVENKALLATVLDQENAPMRGLTPTDILVFEDGVQREVAEVTPAADPMMVSILMDTAKSPFYGALLAKCFKKEPAGAISVEEHTQGRSYSAWKNVCEEKGKVIYVRLQPEFN